MQVRSWAPPRPRRGGAEGAGQRMTRDEALALYRAMLLIRRFEERCAQIYVEGKIGGFLHLYIGPGAAAAGGVGLPRPVAAGMGYAIRLRGTEQVVLCFFGDGAVNEGAFHEALNVSGLWSLPVVYIIENNRYGMGPSLDRASSV